MANLSDLLSRLWHSIAPDLSDPREETPAQAKHRLHHLERSAHAVRAKIERVYTLDPASTPSDAQIERQVQFSADYLIDNARAKHILQHNWVPRDELQQLMMQAERDYLTIFRLQRDLKGIPPTREGYNHYDSERARTNLLNIYANHLTNAAEARFIAHRVDALDAHLLNGIIIRSTIDLATETINKDAHLSPGQIRPKSGHESFQQIDQLRHFWRNRVVELKGALAANEHYIKY